MRWAFVVLATAASCHSVRGCFGEATDRKLHGKVNVELVESTSLTGADINTRRAIRVETKPPFEHGVECTDADLAEDSAGTLVAWRCKSAHAWSVIRLTPSGRHVVENDVPELGRAKPPAFASIKPLVDSATRIGTQILDEPNELEREKDLDTLVAELRAVAPGKVGPMLSDLAATPRADPSPTWIAVVAKLSASERADLEKALCPTLADDAAKPTAYASAAMVCPYDSAAGEAALKILAHQGSAGVLVSSAPQWAVLVAGATKPKEAGVTACAALGAGKVALRKELGALVGNAGIACPAAEGIACDDVAVCGTKVCTPEQARDGVASWSRAATLSSPTAVRKLADVATGPLLAAYVQPKLDEAALRSRERATYTMVNGAGTPCSDVSLARGAPCACGQRLDTATACKTPATAKSIEVGSCSFPVDDKSMTLGPPVRTCISVKGTVCENSFGCCAPLKCVYKGGTRSECE